MILSPQTGMVHLPVQVAVAAPSSQASVPSTLLLPQTGFGAVVEIELVPPVKVELVPPVTIEVPPVA